MNGLEASLVREAGILPETLERARERLRDGRDLGDVLLEMGAVTADRWGEIQARYYGLPFVGKLNEDSLPLELIPRLPIQFAKRHNVLPIGVEGDAVIVATANPSSVGLIGDLRLLFGKPIRAVVAPAPAIAEAINKAYDRASGTTAELVSGLDEERLDLLATELNEPVDLLDANDEAPIIRLVNQLIYQAVKDRASDIHIEPFERELVVRFRIDGILYDMVKPPKRFQPVIVSREKNIITIEDPIEYQLSGVGQMQVNPKIELTFANGLRSILRQDPDVIMVGEIRDVETAEIAIHAALTGHLVFSTLHTNDSFGAVTRLVDMGIEPFLVSSAG